MEITYEKGIRKQPSIYKVRSVEAVLFWEVPVYAPPNWKFVKEDRSGSKPSFTIRRKGTQQEKDDQARQAAWEEDAAQAVGEAAAHGG